MNKKIPRIIVDGCYCNFRDPCGSYSPKADGAARGGKAA